MAMKRDRILELARERLGIATLNEMQQRVMAAANAGGDVMLLSPTGTGKTLAFAVPLLAALREGVTSVQAVVIVPSRELALQVADVLRSISTGVRIATLYGGHNSRDEQRTLEVAPDVIVATPGRLLDHRNRGTVDLSRVREVVLDEFDKSLELGFESEMRRLMSAMKGLKRRWLTSATAMDVVPEFVGMSSSATTIDCLDYDNTPAARINQWQVDAPVKDKLDTLAELLLTIGNERVMVFVGYRESVDRVVTYLRDCGIAAGGYHGALQQHEREMALWRLAGGATPVLVTTDLGSRGLDIEAVNHVVHYHLPATEQVMTHRNGRTARVDATGNVYYIVGPDEYLPQWVEGAKHMSCKPQCDCIKPIADMLHFAAGKKEKISRGDIVGFLVACGGLQAHDIGRIFVADHYALVAVPAGTAAALLPTLNAGKIKGRRVRVSQA